LSGWRGAVPFARESSPRSAKNISALGVDSVRTYCAGGGLIGVFITKDSPPKEVCHAYSLVHHDVVVRSRHDLGFDPLARAAREQALVAYGGLTKAGRLAVVDY
jgi:hypothetical protein